MTNASRRTALARLGASAATWAIGIAALRPVAIAWAQAADEHEIEVIAKRFNFTPNEIPVPRDVAVTLAIKALDFPHGFNVPDLGLRQDLMPGKVVRVKLPPLKPGEYAFLCDNFCGDGHEGMSGKLVVAA